MAACSGGGGVGRDIGVAVVRGHGVCGTAGLRQGAGGRARRCGGGGAWPGPWWAASGALGGMCARLRQPGRGACAGRGDRRRISGDGAGVRERRGGGRERRGRRRGEEELVEYVRDGAEIYRRSFATIRAEA